MAEAARQYPSPRPHVLFVEDERAVREHLAQALGDEFLIDVAEDGAQALKQVLRSRPDVVVTDVIMPDLDGIELLKTLRGVPSTRMIPVLLTSGRAPEDLRIEGFEQGADGYLAKPYTERELRARIRAMVQLARERTEATRREALEQAELQSERAALLASITDAFYALDSEWRFTYVNQLALDYFGRSREELLGTRVWDLVPEARGSEFEVQYRRAIREQRSVAFEVVSPLSRRWIDVHAYPTPRGLAVNFRDITERKQVEQALRESEVRYRYAFDAAAVSLWEEDFTGVAAFIDELKASGITNFREHFDPRPELVLEVAAKIAVRDVNRATLLIFGADSKQAFIESLGKTLTTGAYEVFKEILIAFAEGSRTFSTDAELRTFRGELRNFQVTINFPAADEPLDRVLLTMMDITERGRAQTALRRSEERYRALVTNSSEGIWRYELSEPLDPTLPLEEQLEHLYRHTYLAEANAAMARMYGHESAEDLEGVPLAQMLPRHDPAAQSYLRQIIQAGYRLNDIESVERDPDGRQRCFSRSTIPVFENGKLVRAWGIQREVTARRAAEQGLARQRRLYEAILTNTPDLAYIFDLDHRFIYANECLLQMWGKTWSEAVGKNCLELGYEPAHAAMHDREIDQVIATKQLVRGEVPYTGTFGRRMYDYLFVPVLDANGEVEAVAGTTRDVTEQKLQEHAARTAAARNAVRVQLADALRPLQDPVKMESAATRILGEHLDALRVMYADITSDGEYAVVRTNYLSSATSVVGTHPLDHFGALFIREFRAGHTLLIENVAEDPRLDAEARARTLALGIAAHLLVPLMQAGRPIAALAVHYGTPHAWRSEELTFIEEFAERTWLALERARSEYEVRQANRRKDEFLATLAHELRNPLAPMRSAAQLLRMPGIGEAKARSAREIIERQIQHMVRLIDDLMDVSRITLGQVNLRYERVNLGAVITDALDASRPLIEAGGHSLDVHLPPAPLYVEGDGTRLSQVFQNLLNNAAKYTPAGGRIALYAARRGNEAFISVRDTGVGIPKEVRERIFDLFTRIDPSESIKVSGLGIGLALAKQLVELHNGRIEVQSEGAGHGSEFTVVLPMLEPNSHHLPAASHEAPNSSSESGRRVLVVDDNRDAAESLAMLLQASGCEVSVAFSGPEALRLLESRAPEIVLLDIGMPGMDGYEVARRIRSSVNYQGVFLVALTGWGQAEDKRRAAEAGFDEHVTKPVDPAQLGELLGRARSSGS
jgi:PAS domain S-box-containing protein